MASVEHIVGMLQRQPIVEPAGLDEKNVHDIDQETIAPRAILAVRLSMNDERYFYHSFPRPKGDRAEDEKKGIAVLSSVLDRGLLLAPEVLEFKETLHNGELSEGWKLFQKRICFTELSPEELARHARLFGAFAFEWEIGRLRELGAIPVSYVPLSAPQQSLERVGPALLSRFGETQEILKRLVELKAAVEDAQDDAEVLRVSHNGIVSPTRCIIAGARDLIGFLEHGMQPVSSLLASAKALSGYYYPVENLTYTDQLGYYRQREWRIVGNMLAFGEPVTDQPTEDDVKALTELDSDFFAREVDFPSGRQQRAWQCQFFRRFREQPVYKSIRRIIVPSAALEEVNALLKDRAVDLPTIAIESLG